MQLSANKKGMKEIGLIYHSTKTRRVLSTMPPRRRRTHSNLPEVEFSGNFGYLAGTTKVAGHL
jgi:hypothetical protein